MNIYISNLSYSATDDNLNDLFATYGEITSAKVIFDKYTNRSRGFGFVEMANDEQANAAIEGLNQTDHMGKTINVSEAKPREERPRTEFKRYDNNGGGGNGGGRGGYNNDRRDNKRW